MSKQKTKKTKQKENALKNEIIGIIIIGISLFALLSMLFDLTGQLGRVISSLFLGLFGFGGYILPLLAIMGTIGYFIQRDKMPTKYIVLFSLLFLTIITSIHLFATETAHGENLVLYIKDLYTKGAWNNGGLIGGVIGNFLYVVMGFGGSMIVLSLLVISIIILLTGESLVEFMKKQANTLELKKAANEIEKEALEKEREKEWAIIEKEAKAIAQAEKIDKHLLEVGITETTGKGDKEPDIMLFTEQIKMEKEATMEKRSKEPRGSLYVSSDIKAKEPKILLHEQREKAAFFSDGWMEDMNTGDEILSHRDNELMEETNNQELFEAYVYDEPKDTIDKLIKGRKDIDFYGFEEKEKETITLPTRKVRAYEAPPISLLNMGTSTVTKETKAQILDISQRLEETLLSFGVEATVKEVSRGPTVTRYELSPGHGVRVSKIANLSDDIALSLAATTIRIEAPVPGKSVIGIELPNQEPEVVTLREVLESQAFFNHPSNISVALGKDIAGETVVADIAKMPHLLIAGATGSGKSVCINALILSILYKAGPEEVKLIMIDPKVVELNMYNGIPHLLIPVVTDPSKASNALNWAVREMERRYQVFAENNVKNCEDYNEFMVEIGEAREKLPQIVIIVDELSDLMMSSAKEVEESICRLAQMARAAGIHLVIATQRPSVNVITGLIKANIPSRLAFAVSSGVDSRTVLDQYGAEKLLGKGDMLFHPVGFNKPMRVQGAFVSAKEIELVVDFVKEKNPTSYDEEVQVEIEKQVELEAHDEVDELFQDALVFISSRDRVSISLLQRHFRIGYNRAARMVDEMDNRGLLGPEEGSKPRKVLVGTTDTTNS